MKKIISAILSIALFAFVAVSCEKKEESKCDVQSISISPSEITLAQGTTAKVSVAIAPEGTYSGTFTFTSDATKMIVEEEGNLDQPTTGFGEAVKLDFDVATKTITITAAENVHGYELASLVYEQQGFNDILSNSLKIIVPEKPE